MTISTDDDVKFSEELDHALQATVGKITHGISPAALAMAFLDWYIHLSFNPAKQVALLELTRENYLTIFSTMLTHNQPNLAVTPNDKRFKDTSWQEQPYRYLYESFLMMQNWWHTAATNVHGVSKHHEEVVDFTIRQMIDIFSPSNYPWSNPEVKHVALAERGENFIRGFENFIDDFRREQMHEPPLGAEHFIVGKDVAMTPGKVIYRNKLIELIQYFPMTDDVYAEPILITPAWIMKYYILDLKPKHSLVQYLLKKGHTVFMISWKNPTKEYSQTTLNDYVNLGIKAALDVVSAVVPDEKIHLVGYCLGGTLSAITTALMAREEDNRLASMTLFAAQTDFTEPGELGLFIDESQIAFLENIMRENGYLDAKQMAGTFQLLRSNDLIWSRMVHDYQLGKRKPLTDLMAWNADATRLPYKMHSEYLRKMYLYNELAEGKYQIDGRAIALSDITIPIFVVATERDHVSPWHSVFKINLLTDSNVTFALTSGGHNVGIVSMPVKNTKRYYRLSTLNENERYIDPDTWYQQAKIYHGSWWPAWEKWITKLSSQKTKPPTLGNKQAGYTMLTDAPGTYVLEK